MAIDNIMTVVEKITENSSRCDNVFIFYRFSFFFKIYHGRYYFFFSSCHKQNTVSMYTT